MEERVISQPVRLFRADQGYRYKGRIHEQLVRSGPSQEVAGDMDKSETCTGEQSQLIETEPLAPLCLVHDGYLASTIAQEHKPRRNLKLIERELADEPAQPFHLYNLGVTYCQLGEVEKAIEAFSESLHLTELLAPYRPTLVRDYAKTLVGSERYDEAHAILAVERQRYPSYADLHLLYGETLELQGLEERAYQSYARATDCREGIDRVGQSDGGSTLDASYVTEAGSNSYRAYTAMARLAQKRGFYKESAHLYGLALDSMFTYAPAWAGLADVLQQSGETDENIAETLLSRSRGIGESDHGDLIRGETPHSYAVTNEDHLVQMIYVLTGCGAYEQALKMLDRDSCTARIHVADQIHWMLCANRVSEDCNWQKNTGTWGVCMKSICWLSTEWIGHWLVGPTGIQIIRGVPRNYASTRKERLEGHGWTAGSAIERAAKHGTYVTRTEAYSMGSAGRNGSREGCAASRKDRTAHTC